MKKIILILIATITIVSCASDTKSLERIIESGNLEKIRTFRGEIVTEQIKLNDKLNQIDVAISKLDTVKNLPLITTFIAKKESFSHYLDLQGSVETDQNIVITPEMSGILVKVLVKDGQKVSKGQLLASIDDGGMSQQLGQLQIQLDLAKTTYERQQHLWEQNIGSEIQYLQAKSSFEGQQRVVNQMKIQLEKSNVRAPFSGTIDQIITKEGSIVTPGQTQLIRIVNLSDMYIVTEVPESYISVIVKGKSVEVNFPVLGKKIDAKIRQTGSFINPNNRTFRVEIDVPNDDQTIKPNLMARLKINDYMNEEALLIPQSIISENSAGEQYIYVLQNKNNDLASAKKTIIKTGMTEGDVIEVLEGLVDGDEIINEGARSVKDGQNVKILTY